MSTPRQRFIAKHGGTDVMIFVSTGRIAFPDGAYMESAAYGFQVEPPDDDFECAKMVVGYHEAKVKLATEEFMKFKEQLTAYTNAVLRDGRGHPGASPESITQLKELKRKVQKCERELAKAEKEVRKYGETEQDDIDARAASLAESNVRNATILNKINNITV